MEILTRAHCSFIHALDHSRIYSFIKYLLSSSYSQGIVISSKDITVNKCRQCSCLYYAEGDSFYLNKYI